MNVQPSCCLDVVVYMLNCVFWRHILLEIEFKSRVDMGSESQITIGILHSGITHERVNTSSCRDILDPYVLIWIDLDPHLNQIKEPLTRLDHLNTPVSGLRPPFTRLHSLNTTLPGLTPTLTHLDHLNTTVPGLRPTLTHLDHLNTTLPGLRPALTHLDHLSTTLPGLRPPFTRLDHF